MPQSPGTFWQSGWRGGEAPSAIPATTTPEVAALSAWRAFLPDWFLKWAPPATLGAIGLSFLIHVLIGVIAAIIHFGGAQAGGAGDAPGSGGVGVAVMTEAELGKMQNAGLDADAPAVPEVAQTALPGGEADLGVQDAAGAGGDQGGLLSGAGTLTSGMGAGNISGGPGLGGGGSGGGAASFFGIEARGTRFAYICDISGSMDATVGTSNIKRIDILKGELGRSLEALLENAHFFVCLFSSNAAALGNRMEWISANDAGKQWARRTVPLIAAEGSTEPVNAFRIVFALRPKPDAIYFMTDGEFDETYAAQIARMNGEWHIPIHCITFVSREGEKIMKKIAADSGGTYAHFSGPGGE
jgi:hypothetical protein